MPTVTPTAASALGNSGVSIGSPVVWVPSGVALGNVTIRSGVRATGAPRDEQSFSYGVDPVLAPSAARTPVHEAMTGVESRTITFTNDEVSSPSHPRTPTHVHLPYGAKDSDGGLY